MRFYATMSHDEMKEEEQKETTQQKIINCQSFLKQIERLKDDGIITDKQYKKDYKRTVNELSQLQRS